MLNRYKQNQTYQSHALRNPNFDSGLISEPRLAFGGRHEHVDPKTGLALYGPYTLADQLRPSLSSIIVGIIGPSFMISDAEQWLDACKGLLTNNGSKPLLYPHFPGFNTGLPFQCELLYGKAWQESLDSNDLQDILPLTDFNERVRRTIKLYIRAIETLALREPGPDVIICCFPQEIIDCCTVQLSKTNVVKHPKKGHVDRWTQRTLRNRQNISLVEAETTERVEIEEWRHLNLRRGLKAEAMKFGIPTQLVRPRTLQISNVTTTFGERSIQDIATRAWNFTTALYYKAGGFPWRLNHLDEGTCFVGISFYKEILENNPRMRTSMAQSFTAAGDGYVLRGNSFEWDEARDGKSPHLDQTSAATLIRDVLDLYQLQNRRSLPKRIVIHKTSRFWPQELAGFTEACRYIPQKDFIALGRRGIQFYRTGNYPPLRGTYIKFSQTNFLLYTTGYIPFLHTYPGPRVPQPLEILEHYGDSPWKVILEEILALTKMNWNTADFTDKTPITIAFSQRVGQILAELPPSLNLRPEYRFYM